MRLARWRRGVASQLAGGGKERAAHWLVGGWEGVLGSPARGGRGRHVGSPAGGAWLVAEGRKQATHGSPVEGKKRAVARDARGYPPSRCAATESSDREGGVRDAPPSGGDEARGTPPRPLACGKVHPVTGSSTQWWQRATRSSAEPPACGKLHPAATGTSARMAAADRGKELTGEGATTEEADDHGTNAERYRGSGL